METLTGKTQDIVSDNIAQLKELFPEICTEGKIDFDALKQVLGESVDADNERYSFTWHGKSDAKKMALKQSTGTLRPKKEESKDWDTTKNLFLEGDNLEVLRILQNSYRGKVKMIYIDPPYNTGKDFVYTDNFSDNIKNYKEKVGETMKANADSSGRYHTNWLNMMYPRLRLAKNLLKDDGVIFISIDDNELVNLRKICDEIFGEDNFIAQLPTVMNLKGNQDEFGFAGTHEYTLVFAKNKNEELKLNEFIINEEELEKWEEDEIGPWKKGANLKATGVNAPREKRPNLFYPIYVNENNEVSLTSNNETDLEILPITDNSDMSWRWGKDTFIKNKHDVIIIRDDKQVSLYKKQRPDLGELPSKKPKTLFYKPEYSSGNGTAQFRVLFNDKVFNNPKPIGLIKDVLQIGTNTTGDIVVDFFAGSGTTAHSVMSLNIEDGGNRKFIMVQIPESTPEDSEARRVGYETIADIGKERIRRAGEKIKTDYKDKEGIEKLDVGFKVFTLDETNFVEWDENTKDVEGELLKSLESIKQDRSQEDALYEILLKYGIALTMPIQELDILGKKVYSLSDNYLLVCLEKDLSLDVIKEIATLKPNRVVFYDDGFKDDTIKANAEQTLKKNGVEDIRVI